MASSRNGYLALGNETTKSVVVKPTKFLPFKSGDIKYAMEVIKNNPIKGVRANNIQAKKGKVTLDGTYNFDLDTYNIGYLLRLALGSYSVTNLTNAYKHTFNVANKLPSASIEQCKGDPTGQDREITRSFGVMVDQFEMAASDGIASFNVNVKAHGQFIKGTVINDITAGSSATITLKGSESEGLVDADILQIVDVANSTVESITATDYTAPVITANVASSYEAADNIKVELRPQTPSFDCEDTILSWFNFKFQFGADLTAAAAAAPENVENWTLTFMNNLEERFGSLRNSPSVIGEKGWDGSLNFTKFYETNKDRDYYLNLDRRACIITGDAEKKIGNTIYNYKIEIKLNDLRFTTNNKDVETDSLLVDVFESGIFHNCTDGKAIEINIWNNLTTYAS